MQKIFGIPVDKGFLMYTYIKIRYQRMGNIEESQYLDMALELVWRIERKKEFVFL